MCELLNDSLARLFCGDMFRHAHKHVITLGALLGMTAFSAGAVTLEEARAAATKGNAAAQLELARVAFKNYRFNEALDALDRYQSKLAKGAEPSAESADLRRRSELGVSMLDRVENIQIIDSLEVDAVDFFKAFNLSAPSGSVVDAEIAESVIPDSWRREHPDATVSSPVYVTESGERMIMSTEGGDNATSTTMWEIDRLADGTWDSPRAIFDYATIFDSPGGGESVYSPFLMSDGVTLYFGAEGDASLGGLDIFISRCDEDGVYLQPQNLGMPYNSPSDDYLLAIDELTGIGWWATDRAGKPGRVTIYLFVPSDLRVNYSPDTENLIGLASLSAGISATQAEGADYSELLSRLPRSQDVMSGDDNLFVFPLAGKAVYTSLDDFKSDNARHMMEDYMDMLDEFSNSVQQLYDLRMRYRDGDHSLKDSILHLEKSIEQDRARLQSKANEVVKAEIGSAIN